MSITTTSGRVRAAVLRVAGVGAALIPAGMLMIFRIRQPEVDVVERSARVLLDTGWPYLGAPAELADVNPYLPAMALFGLPRQLLGDTVLADARLWFLAVFVTAVAAATALIRPRPSWGSGPSDGSIRTFLEHPATLMWAVLSCPLVALHAAAGGHDLPVVGLTILAAAILGIAAWLVRRPPRDLARAATTLALAETIAVLLLPTSRFGYLAFPAVLLLWAAPARRSITRVAERHRSDQASTGVGRLP